MKSSDLALEIERLRRKQVGLEVDRSMRELHTAELTEQAAQMILEQEMIRLEILKHQHAREMLIN